MDCSAGECKRPARANGDDVRVPAVGLARAPEIEHALSAANGEVPRQEMNQSWTSVSWTKLSEIICQINHILYVDANFNPMTQFISPPIFASPLRRLHALKSSRSTVRMMNHRSDGFDPSIDEWLKRDFMSDPDGPGIGVDAD